MRKMIRYQNGEVRVIDTASMTASEFLTSSDLGSDLEDYNLDCEINEPDINAPHEVIR